MNSKTLWHQTMAGLRLLLVATVLLGVGYPMAIWGVTRLPGLRANAEGSRIVVDDSVVGSALIGIDPKPTGPDGLFHTRPSASGGPSVTGGSNRGGASAELLSEVRQRRGSIARRESVPAARVPAEAVTASASGVDPHIGPAYAELQVPRVARVHGWAQGEVRELVAEHVSGGVFGVPVVNVPGLNAALAERDPAHSDGG